MSETKPQPDEVIPRLLSMSASPKGASLPSVQEYRPDVDGLRAIAVVSVVIFHLFGAVLPGVYLGVDVFFVISGYLITGILVREFDPGRYSILSCYERRVRRIVPALLLVVTLSTIAATALLLSTDLVNFGQSVLAAFAFVSNVFFWRTAGYFDTDAVTKPLLHTWSLGIEEQFYIVFPLLLWVILKPARHRALLPVLIAATLMSYGINVVALYFKNGFAAFYLLPMRAWELGIGAVLANVRLRAPAWVGLPALAMFALAFVNPKFLPRNVPDATLACLGAALLISSGQGLASRLLSTRPFVGIGLISYSLYLWHWPIFVFASYVVIRPLTVPEGLAVALMSVGAAYLSWRFVERPFRRAMPARRALVATGTGVALLSLMAIALIRTDGLPSRFNAESAAFNRVNGTHYRCSVSDFLSFGMLYGCPVNLPDRNVESADVVLVGNSHAQMYVPAVAGALKEQGLNGLLVPVNGCAPLTDYNASTDCMTIMRTNIAAVNGLKRARVVILSFAWHKVFEDMVDSQGRPVGRLPWQTIQLGIESTIRQLERGGKKVILVGPIPYPHYYVASTVSREVAYRGSALSPLEQTRAEFDRNMGEAVAWVRSSPATAIPLLPSDQLCDARACHYVLNGQPLYADDNHLSSLVVAPLFQSMFEQAIRKARGEAAKSANE